MMFQPFLIIIYIIKSSAQLIVMQAIRRQILDDDALQLLQFHIYLSMMLREGFYIKVCIGITINKCLNIREYHLFLIPHVIGYAMGIIIIKFEDKTCQIIRFIQSLNEFLTDERQLEINIIDMRRLEIMQ